MIEPTPLRLTVMAIIAAILVAFFTVLYFEYRSGIEKSEFWDKAEEMAELVSSLESSDPGTKVNFTIEVPFGATLEFENHFVVAKTENPHLFDAGINVYGPTLKAGSYDLWIKRVNDGVEILARG